MRARYLVLEYVFLIFIEKAPFRLEMALLIG